MATGNKDEPAILSAAKDPAEPGNDLVEPRATILVVEDEEMVRNVARASLEHGGFRVLPAADGDEALRLFAQHSTEISLVLLDLDMPGLSGVQLLRILRRQGLQAPVLVSSGFSELEVARRFQGLAVAGVIEKPFRVDQLIRRVRDALE